MINQVNLTKITYNMIDLIKKPYCIRFNNYKTCLKTAEFNEFGDVCTFQFKIISVCIMI